MRIIPTALSDALVIEPQVFGDARGFFFESFNRRAFRKATGLDLDFVQDNVSRSSQGVLRGLHYQIEQPQGKLVRCIAGEVYDVAVDIRAGSPHFGRAVGLSISAENKRQFYIPPGFAHGFCVTSEAALFVYKCTEFYDPALEGCVRWDDPQLEIDWPVPEPLLSDKDKVAPLLKEIPQDKLPQYPSP